jgi:hypothetical protein
MIAESKLTVNIGRISVRAASARSYPLSCSPFQAVGTEILALVGALIAPMEAAGYKLPKKLWPDISQGFDFRQVHVRKNRDPD